MDLMLIKQFDKIMKQLELTTQDYFHSNPLTSLYTELTGDTFFSNTKAENKKASWIYLNVEDILILGILTNNDILISGKSGIGKSHLARMLLATFFGSDGYFDITIDNLQTKESFLEWDRYKKERELLEHQLEKKRREWEYKKAQALDDDEAEVELSMIDYKAMLTLEKQIEGLLSKSKVISLPAGLINEPNRIPTKTQGFFSAYLERLISIEDINLRPGIALRDTQSSTYYQIRILTMNEGQKYYGTSEIDIALRNRMVIELPFDTFPLTPCDLLNMLEYKSDSSLETQSKRGYLKTILSLYDIIRLIPIENAARDFIAYLGGLSNCIYTFSGIKESVMNFNDEFCKKKNCIHYQKNNGLCGNILSPSNRTLINLENVARGFTFLRLYKTFKAIDENIIPLNILKEYLEKHNIPYTETTIKVAFKQHYANYASVSISDIIKTAPFVLYNKLDLSNKWIQENSEGEQLSAIIKVMNIIWESYIEFKQEHLDLFQNYIKHNKLEITDIKKLKDYIYKENNWIANLKILAMPNIEHNLLRDKEFTRNVLEDLHLIEKEKITKPFWLPEAEKFTNLLLRSSLFNIEKQKFYHRLRKDSNPYLTEVFVDEQIIGALFLDTIGRKEIAEQLGNDLISPKMYLDITGSFLASEDRELATNLWGILLLLHKNKPEMIKQIVEYMIDSDYFSNTYKVFSNSREGYILPYTYENALAILILHRAGYSEIASEILNSLKKDAFSKNMGLFYEYHRFAPTEDDKQETFDVRDNLMMILALRVLGQTKEALLLAKRLASSMLYNKREGLFYQKGLRYYAFGLVMEEAAGVDNNMFNSADNALAIITFRSIGMEQFAITLAYRMMFAQFFSPDKHLLFNGYLDEIDLSINLWNNIIFAWAIWGDYNLLLGELEDIE